MSAYVYLLAHASAPRFKIGKAIELLARTKQLGQAKFDYARSEALRVAGEAEALNLEKLLHRAFAKWRIAPQDIERETGVREDGDTEWFHAECRDRLADFLKSNEDLLGFSLVSPAEVQSLVTPPTAPSPATKPGRKAPPRGKLTAEDRFRQDAEDVAKAVASIDRTQPLLEELAALVETIHLTMPDESIGGASLQGICATSKKELLAELLYKLTDEVIRTHSGGFGIFNGYHHITQEDGIHFELGLIWPNGRAFCQAEAAAAERLASLPIPIAGWTKPVRHKMVLIDWVQEWKNAVGPSSIAA
jgi:hypothetical protein